MPSAISPTSPVLGGSAVPTVAADATGNFVIPGGTDVVLRINNGSGSTVTVTLDDPTTPVPEGSVAVNPDAVISIPTLTARHIVLNKARRARFASPADGKVSWTYSAVTTVTVEAVAV